MTWFKSVWDTFFGYVSNLFEEHKFARRTAFFCAIVGNLAVGYFLLFEDTILMVVSQSPNGQWFALLLGHFVTMNAAVIGLYKWLRERNM